MDASLITLIVNILLIVFAFLGFLWGLGRGVKKSLLRIVTFIVFVVIAAICAPIIAKAIIAIQLPIGTNGAMTSIQDYLVNLITSNETIAENVDNVAGLMDLIINVPLMVVNVVLFVVLVWISKFISWLVFLILSKIIFSKKKKQQALDGNYRVKAGTITKENELVIAEKKEKKHRFLGGLVSACQAVMLLFLTLLPVSGIVSLASKYAYETVDSESNTTQMADSNVEYTATAQMIQDALGEDILVYLDAYQSAVVVKTFNVGNFSDKVFDALTTVKIDGEKVVLSNELSVVSGVYNTVAEFEDFDFDNIQATDFDKIRKLINQVFDSGLIKTLAPELINTVCDAGIKALTSETEGEESSSTNEDLAQVLGDLKTSLNTQAKGDTKMYEVLKHDLLTLVDAFEEVYKSGIITLINSDEATVDDFLDKLVEIRSGQTKCNFQLIIEDIFGLTTVQDLVKSVTNVALSELEQELSNYVNDMNENDDAHKVTITLPRISNISWNNYVQNLTNVFVNGVEVYRFADEVSTLIDQYDDDKTLIKEMYKLDYTKAMNAVGKLLNNLYNNALLSSDSTKADYKPDILHKVYDALAKIDSYNDYINFEALKSLNWEQEVGFELQVINALSPFLSVDVDSYKDIQASKYATIANAISSLFDSSFAKAIKTDTFSLLIDDDDDSILAEIIEFCQDKTQGRLTLSSLKNIFTPYLNVIDIIADAGIIDSIVDGEELDVNSILDNLCVTKEGETQTQLAKLINGIFESDLTNVAIRDLMNQANKSIVQMFDSSYDVDVAGEGYDFKAQKADIIAICEKAVPLLELVDADNFEEELKKAENIDNAQQLLEALKANAENTTYTNGGFFKDAYDALSGKLDDIADEAVDSLTQIDGLGITGVDFSTVDLVEEMKDLGPVIENITTLENITSIEDAVSSENSEALITVLETLQTNTNNEDLGDDSLSGQIYNQVVDYISDTNNGATNQTVADIQDYIKTNYTDQGKTSDEWDWADIIANFNS